MTVKRAFEENEVPAEVRRVYDEVRVSLDLPFVPTIFKLCAGMPDYLTTMWEDLREVARSREFHAAGQALEEVIRSLAIQGGWRFKDQQQALAAQRFSKNDVEMLGLIITTFLHAMPRMALFTRLMQRGYSGGQKGRVTGVKQASATSRLLSLNVPNEREAPLRVWLIYGDIRRTTGARNVLSSFRVLSPYPGYLASVWMDTKRLLGDAAFLRARDELSKRIMGYLVGMPVRDHRAAAKNVSPADWREIEETIDGVARLLPQFALSTAIWQRSFPLFNDEMRAA